MGFFEQIKKNREEKRKAKKERKEFVKQQRTKFKKDPSKFFETEMFQPLIQAWKENPKKQAWVFIKWVLIYYLVFGAIQAVNNDMIYCDATIDAYDGKVMYVHNDFVKLYNERAKQLEQTPVYSYWEQEQLMNSFNEQYSMYCDYDINRWRQESITERIKTIGYGYYKILLKRS